MEKKILWSIMLVFITGIHVLAQTPGMIIKPAEGAGKAILDPDLDGYVSQKVNGSQIGFTIPPEDDIIQSEIPFVPIVRPDPLSDILRGPTGAFCDIVGVDETGKNAIMIYNDGNNLLFRFRMGGYAPNSKSYSVLIDSDQKFGFVGPNADDEAIAGNPGFEAEIVLCTNFTVDVYDVRNTLSGNSLGQYTYESNGQKSIALSKASGDADYFYDFFVPFATLSSLGIDANTPLRFVTLTTMNPHAAIGNNAASDFGGVTTGRNLDDIFEQLISTQTPTSINNINKEGILERSACPRVNSVIKSDLQISGTTTETSGTATVYIYNEEGTSQLTKASAAFSGASWSVPVSAFNPAITLQEGQQVFASITATGKGESYTNCDVEIVSASCSPALTGGIINSNADKGVKVTVPATYAVNSIVRLYKSDGSLFPNTDLLTTGGSAGDPNPGTVVSGDYIIEFKCKTGNCFGNELYLITIQQPNECESGYFYYCGYATGGTTATPTITTNPITTTSTVIKGNGTAAFSVINLYVDGNYYGTTKTLGDAPYAWEIPVSGLSLGQSITAKQIIANQCLSNASTAVLVARKATTPVINSDGCYLVPPTSISGYSTEIGARVDIIRSGGSIGFATVAADGTFNVTGLSLSASDQIKAQITSGTNLLPSDASAITTITTKTPNVPVITTARILEGDAEITGSGVTGDLITLYVDGSAPVKADGSNYTTTVVGGNWTISGIEAYEFYIGAKVTVTAKSAGKCEGDASVSKTVECKNPDSPVYAEGDYNYCIDNAGSIPLLRSEKMVIYELVNSSGEAVGPSTLGTGSGITLYTFPLSANLLNVNVKAYKIGYNTCSATATTKVNFFYMLPTPTVSFTTTSLVAKTTDTNVKLPYSAISSSPVAGTYTIAFSVAAKSKGFADVTTAKSIPAAPDSIKIDLPSTPEPGTYNGTIKIYPTPEGCTRSYEFTITIYNVNGTPVVLKQPVNATICAGESTNLSASAVGTAPVVCQWQVSTNVNGPFSNVSDGSGGTTTSYTTAILAATKYYRAVFTNANRSIASNVVTVKVNPQPVILGTISGNASLCAGLSATYSISPVYNAISYTWEFDGTGATIITSGNSASLTFSSTATTGSISVKGTNSCGTGAAITKLITINPAPFINNMTGVACSGAAFNIAPTNANGIVPVGTNYNWAIPTVSGSVTGGAASGTAQTNINGTLTNPSTTTQTATYTVTPVTGACTGSSFNIVVSVNPPIQATATAVNTVCNGGATGSVNLSVSGGTPGYTFDWDDDGMENPDNDLQNLAGKNAGTYNVTVTDSKGCTKTASATVGQPAGINISHSETNVLCNGASTGAINITVTGGTAPYTYLWNNGNTSEDLNSLTAGTYSVKITDANNCFQGSGNITVTQPAGISVSASVTDAIDCNGGTAEITVTASGGNGTKYYTLDGGLEQGSNVFSGVLASASAHIISVRDDNNCTSNTSVTVTQPSAISISASLTHPTCPPSASISNNNGAIAITVTGGTESGSYGYLWNSGATSQNRNSLTAGTYSVTVTDDNGCTANRSFTLTAINAAPVTPGTITE